MCDPEGGSLKAAADAYEAQDLPLGDRRMVIRNARELVMCGHQNLGKPKSKFFFRKRGQACTDVGFTTFLFKGEGPWT